MKNQLQHRPAKAHLPSDLDRALMVGRVWRGGDINGPCMVVVRHGAVFDVTAQTPTVADLLEHDDLVVYAHAVAGESLGRVEALIEGALFGNADEQAPSLLAPNDVQAIKACGVTFAVSLLERVIEEQASSDAGRAEALRKSLLKDIGADLSTIKPGSPEAEKLKQQFVARGAWPQYMEVDIGPYAEVFSKSQAMSAVVFGADVGLHPDSNWNNPEPEIVLAVNSRAQVVGATLGNDVNLRDIEGRSALLLGKGKAKDNNGSCPSVPLSACSMHTSTTTPCAAPNCAC